MMVALDDLGAFSPLLGQLERGLEEVHVKPRRCIKAPHRLRCLDAFEAAVTKKAPDNRAVLLLYKGLVVLLIGA